MNKNKVRSKYYFFVVSYDIRVIHKMHNNVDFDYFIFNYYAPKRYYCIVSSKSGNAVYLRTVCKAFDINECDVYKLSNINDYLDYFVLNAFYKDINFYYFAEYTGVFKRYVEKAICLYDLQSEF